jgi:hypothetical protein
VASDFDQELNKAIAYFEGRFGKRDMRFQLQPVELHQKRFAQTLVSEAAHTITVCLDEATREDDLLLKHQLWHEAVHCLAPTESIQTIWFEEGLAVWCAMRAPFVNRKFRRAREKHIDGTSWGDPYRAFVKLKATDEQIRTVHERAPGRKFDNITANLIVDVFGVKDDLANQLCRRMGTDRDVAS